MVQGSTSIVHDVVIIGSGAGGGTVTKVLADMAVLDKPAFAAIVDKVKSSLAA